MKHLRPTKPPGPKDLLIYYGPGGLPTIAGYQRAVLQPGHYSRQQLQQLREAGTETLAYLSLGEDPGPAAPWQRSQVNPDWGGHYVSVAHAGWRTHCLALANRYLAQGFSGLFIDTLDTPDMFPEDRAAMLDLIRDLRVVANGYLLANRGLGLLPESAAHVNGYLFESFSATWQGDGYRALTLEELHRTMLQAHLLQATRRDLYALDYADTAELIGFARARAATHGFSSVISNRTLTYLPEQRNQACPRS